MRPPCLRAHDDVEWLHVDQLGHEALRKSGPGWAHLPQRFRWTGGNLIEGLDLGRVLVRPTVQRLVQDRAGSSRRAAVRTILASGPELIVATGGAIGAWLAQQAQKAELVHVWGFAVRAASTLRAGDIFHGALIAGLPDGLLAGEAVRFANPAAAVSCKAVDAQNGAPTRDSIDQFLKQCDRRG
jgi:sulfofructose kinase